LKGSLLTFVVVAVLAAGAAAVARNAQSTSESPAVVAAVAPATYPAVARQARAHGEVAVDVQIDAAGAVLAAKMISGHPLLQKVSEDAAKQWKFAPSQGSTKERVVRLTFSFETVDASRNPKYEFTIVFLPPYRVDVREHGIIIE
jgi:TonB family protein